MSGYVAGVLSSLVLLAGVLRFGASVAAQTSLPLANLGIEHLDIVVPDPAASARFYARVFRTSLHQQPVRDTLRYFVLLGDLPADRQVGYIAIGAAQGRAPAIGHYCVLARAYARDTFAAALRAAGLPAQPTAPGPIGMWPDPDGLELQLFQPPAGLVTAAVDSPLPVEGAGVVSPLGVDHVLLQVSDVERSLAYYRALYGAAAERPRDASGRVWFQLERGTRLGLEQNYGRRSHRSLRDPRSAVRSAGGDPAARRARSPRAAGSGRTGCGSLCRRQRHHRRTAGRGRKQSPANSSGN